jgi:ribonuclease HII
MLFLQQRLFAEMELGLLASLLLACSMIRPSAPFEVGNSSVYLRSLCQKTRATTTRCWGKYGRNTPKRTRIDTDDILSYERTLITDRGYSYVLGSDETGRGSIAGPVVTATCCIRSLSNDKNGDIIDASELPTVGILPPPDSSGGNNLVQDSKQLFPEDRERIYEAIVGNPEVYAFSIAQRSNTEIDDTGNILRSTMDAFQESIEDLAKNDLFPYIYSRQTNTGNSDPNDKADSVVIPDDWEDCGCYGIVDGKKSPKISTLPSFPCRPMVKADKQVYTVALASIIAKVTLDRMFEEWHKEYPQYRFDQNKGYATKDHIEAIHKFGPCPLHRMTFKSLKGR